MFMSFACRMETTETKQTLFCFDLHDACLFEECAWQVELFLFLHVSGRRQFKRGMCDV